MRVLRRAGEGKGGIQKNPQGSIKSSKTKQQCPITCRPEGCHENAMKDPNKKIVLVPIASTFI
jgi:hypothetical protein